MPLALRPRFVFTVISGGLLCAPALFAQTPVPANPVVGSSNSVTAEPPVARPSTPACVAPLFTAQQFADYTDKKYTFMPSCKGPWAKVVFTADFNVSAGRQFDRTARFFLGGANIYFGTTAEPRAALSPSWHVERDVTDLSALFNAPQPVVASLGNFVGTSGGVDYNGIITGSARLEFYPAGPNDAAAAVPDAVLPLNPAGGVAGLQTTADRLTGTFPSLPKNIERASLQLFAQSQAGDEFWYTCSPDNVASALQNCGGTGFRETEVYVDGRPAGIAPVFPWIYTGGIDPTLWEPITGVQTLNFKPYTVDLTPFAGVLSDGKQHTVGIGVFNANHEFDVTGTLLLYLDKDAAQVTGAVTADTLGPEPTPYVQAQAPVDKSGTTHGESFVNSQRQFTVSGYVNTSKGRVETTVDEQVDFANYQRIDLNSLLYTQDLAQLNTVSATTTTVSGGEVAQTQQSTVYPFTFKYNSTTNADGSSALSVNVYQQDLEFLKNLRNGAEVYSTGIQEVVNSSDAYTVNAAGVLGNRSTTGSTHYQSTDTRGHCYSRDLTANGLKLATVTDGAVCGGVNRP